MTDQDKHERELLRRAVLNVIHAASRFDFELNQYEDDWDAFRCLDWADWHDDSKPPGMLYVLGACVRTLDGLVRVTRSSKKEES